MRFTYGNGFISRLKLIKISGRPHYCIEVFCKFSLRNTNNKKILDCFISCSDDIHSRPVQNFAEVCFVEVENHVHVRMINKQTQNRMKGWKNSTLLLKQISTIRSAALTVTEVYIVVKTVINNTRAILMGTSSAVSVIARRRACDGSGSHGGVRTNKSGVVY